MLCLQYKVVVSSHRYSKPSRRPEPTAVSSLGITDVRHDCNIAADNLDLIWLLGRQASASNERQKIPAWTGFNTVISECNLPVSSVSYMPFLRGSPSDLSTIYTVLCRLVKCAESLGQDHLLVTADMAIYSKAQERLWSKPVSLDGKVTMRLRGLHTAMALVASLGKIFGDGGLLSLLVESGIYAEATARQMLQGSQIARAIRGIKIVYEALFRVFYDAFKIYMQNSNRLNPIEATESKLDDLAHAFSMNNTDITSSAVDEIVDEHLGNISEALIEFRTAGRESSATFKFWDDFMEGAKVLLHLIRAEREGNFDLHLNAMCKSLPWFRAAGKLNYAKYTPIYVADMRALEEQHPQSFQHLVSGGFVVRRTNNHNFNAVSTDQALEQTINREGKNQGGIIGLTLRKKALN